MREKLSFRVLFSTAAIIISLRYYSEFIMASEMYHWIMICMRSLCVSTVGCEYGDKAQWCANYVRGRNIVNDVKSPNSVVGVVTSLHVCIWIISLCMITLLCRPKYKLEG